MNYKYVVIGRKVLTFTQEEYDKLSDEMMEEFQLDDDYIGTFNSYSEVNIALSNV